MTFFIAQYNNRKRRYHEEKEQMKAAFELELTKAQIEVQEQTMETIATDLHDNIGQLLSVISITLASINGTNTVKATEKIALAHGLVTRSIQELRHLAKLMQASSVIQNGLEEAIKNELAYIEKSGRFTISFQSGNFNKINIPLEHEIIIFRICQELLNNILKHAEATSISVSLLVCKNGLDLLVEDNGKGFKKASTANSLQGMGLKNIEKRTAILGGDIVFKNQPQGTSIKISVPVSPLAQTTSV